jgi:LysM repeat protein
MKRIIPFILITAGLFLTASCGSSKKLPSGRKTTQQSQSTSGPNDIKTMKYIAKFKRVAQQEMRDYGIPASITMAQGILESASGTSELARYANNHFGIKCAEDWNGEKVYKDDDHKNECFRKYKDPAQSYNDHSKFLAKRRRYAFLFRLPPTDYEAWAKGLKKAGYATDPSYSSKLIYIIEKYKLHELDREVLNKMNIKQETVQQDTVQNKGEKIIYEVKAGETLYTIAKKFNIPVKEIKELNNLVDFDIYEGQILVLKVNEETNPETNSGDVTPPTQSDETVKNQEDRAESPVEQTRVDSTQTPQTAGNNPEPQNENFIIHTVQPKETLYSIAKQYGTDMETIKKLNGLSDNNLTVGQNLKIPAKEEESTQPVTEQPGTTMPSQNPVKQEPGIPAYHIVQPGETLYRIHVKYKVPLEKLRKLNNLKDNTIFVGQKIKLR